MPTFDNGNGNGNGGGAGNVNIPATSVPGTNVKIIDNSYVAPAIASLKSIAVIGPVIGARDKDGMLLETAVPTGVPTLITNWTEFESKFGGKHSDYYAPFLVDSILKNGSNVLFTSIDLGNNNIQKTILNPSVVTINLNDTYGISHKVMFEAGDNPDATNYYLTIKTPADSSGDIEINVNKEIIGFQDESILTSAITIDKSAGKWTYDNSTNLITIDIQDLLVNIASSFTDVNGNQAHKLLKVDTAKTFGNDIVLISQYPDTTGNVIMLNSDNIKSYSFGAVDYTFNNISSPDTLYGIDISIPDNQLDDVVKLILNHYEYDFSNIFIPGLNLFEHKMAINRYANYIKDLYNNNSMLVFDYTPANTNSILGGNDDVLSSFNMNAHNIQDLESSNVACYYPPINMYNLEDEIQMYPATIYVAGLYSTVESINMPWRVISGINRGVLQGNITLSRKLNKYQMGLLYDGNINPIISYVTKTDNPVVWGQKTGLVDGSALSRINVAKLMIYLSKEFLSIGDGFAFEFNDVRTRNALSKQLSNILDNVKMGRGIYDYKVKCDTENNTPTVIDRNQLVAGVWVKPSRSAEFIYIPVSIEKTETTL